MLSAGFYSNHINFRLNENPVEFLDNTELKCLNHLAEKVLVNFIRGLAGICLNEIAGCRNLGQVYLGNIKDFQE